MVSLTALLLTACAVFGVVVGFLPADPAERQELFDLHDGAVARDTRLLVTGKWSEGDPSKDSSTTIPVREVVYPDHLSQEAILEPLFEAISTDRLRGTMTKLTSFHNRFYNSEDGAAATDWIHSQVLSFSKDAEVKRMDHGWAQKTLDVRVKSQDEDDEGEDEGDGKRKLIVTGAHVDSINIQGGKEKAITNPAPGADDNASGVAVILEALRIIMTTGVYRNFTNEVHFHFYSAEETGLHGSRGLFGYYANEGREVVAMLNQDMTGHKNPRGETDHFTMITDNVSTHLNNFLKRVIKRYTDLGIKYKNCGYACSDHYSAHKNGFPAAFASHGASDGKITHIHTTEDNLDKINYGHMRKHVRLVLGYLVELGLEPFVG